MSPINNKIGKFLVPGALAAGLLMTSSAHAGPRYDQARVVSVEPVYESVRYEVPVQQCYQEDVPVRRHHRSATPSIVGALIGGALGHAVGHKKRNKQVGAVLGAVLGGSIGADVGRRNRAHHDDHVRYETREVCDTDYQVRHENQLTGYDVRYRYGGRTYQTRMDRDPGEYIRVRVRVRPA